MYHRSNLSCTGWRSGNILGPRSFKSPMPLLPFVLAGVFRVTWLDFSWMGVWRKVRLKKGTTWNFLCTVKYCYWIYFPSWTSKTGGLGSWVLLKLANWAVSGRISKWNVSFFSLLSKMSGGFLVVTLKVLPNGCWGCVPFTPKKSSTVSPKLKILYFSLYFGINSPKQHSSH